MPPKAAETHSSRREKQRWWARSRGTAAWEVAGLSCHFRRRAAHRHTWTWPPGLPPLMEGGQVAVVPPAAAPWKEEGCLLHGVSATLRAG